MNFIWYPLIEAIQQDYDTTKLHYRVKDRKFFTRAGDEELRYLAGAHQISPYLEYTPLALYDPDKAVKLEETLARADINPYIRFGSIYKHILLPERNDPNDLLVCDIITHMLAHIDRICGMSRRDFRVLLIMNEIAGGCFGDRADVFKLFSTPEKRGLAEALIMLYETGNTLRSLDALFGKIMTDFSLRLRDNEEVVFYNPYGFMEQEDKKLRFIIELFLPVDFPFVIHWRYTYGTTGLDESTIMERFVL
jgi:hypothetical protein